MRANHSLLEEHMITWLAHFLGQTIGLGAVAAALFEIELLLLGCLGLRRRVFERAVEDLATNIGRACVRLTGSQNRGTAVWKIIEVSEVFILLICIGLGAVSLLAVIGSITSPLRLAVIDLVGLSLWGPVHYRITDKFFHVSGSSGYDHWD